MDSTTTVAPTRMGIGIYSPALDEKGNSLAGIRLLEKLSQEQRREDIKISHTVQVTVRLAGSDTYAPATVQNISAGGVYLTTSMPARKGNQLTFDFPQADGAIPLTAEVLRVELRPPQKGRLAYGYGCRFVRLSSRHEAQLRSYVFKLARR